MKWTKPAFEILELCHRHITKPEPMNLVQKTKMSLMSMVAL
jgi:hypothetical protein